MYSELPAVYEVLDRLPDLARRFPRELVVEEIRRAVAEIRNEIRSGTDRGIAVEDRVMQALENLEGPSLHRVINATGVVLHTNLGRAPLGDWQPISGYSNLEYNLDAGKRGKRDVHLEDLLERLLGKPGIAVNNNAAAVYLVLNELAAGFEVIVSRGELIEIGDGFRIPDIMDRSTAVLREVGTTNKTHLDDYRQAFTDRTRLILTVHHSNFRISGFTGRPSLKELIALGRERGVPVYQDLGSGCLVDLRKHGIDEPLVPASLGNGVDLVSFSGDKLLGGPQAGIIAGQPELVKRLRQNPMFRALRLDKLIYQSLETTLRNVLLGRYEHIPTLRMITESAEHVRSRAEALLGQLPKLDAELREGESLIGGGSTPEQSIPTWLVAIRATDVVASERKLRQATPPVIARIEDDRIILDLRTVFPEEESELVAVLQALS
jgi:L-seryl-tRNA(Ser) seleniumtransferase